MKPIFLFLCLFLTFSAVGTAQQNNKLSAQAETSFKNYLNAGNVDEIEGIYKTLSGPYFKLAIKKSGDGYEATILEMDEKVKKFWKNGEVKANLEKTAVQDLYSIKWIWNDRTSKETTALLVHGGVLKIKFTYETISLLKLYPHVSE